MDMIHQLFTISPFIALFITLALGHLAGKITLGRFTLGGVAGTLIMGIIIGQFGVSIAPGVKSIFFALFIYVVGYQGSAQLFKSFNFKTTNMLLSAIVMVLSGLLCVLAAAWFFDLDSATTTGLAAGGLVQSSMIDTAGDAIGRLSGLTDHAIQLMQSNIAVGYAITYIFASLSPILMITWAIPTFMKWDIRAEALKLATTSHNGAGQLAPGEQNTISTLVTRAFKVDANSTIKGITLDNISNTAFDVCIELVERHGQAVKSDKSTAIIEGDLLIITGRQQTVYQLQDNVIGLEVDIPNNINVVEKSCQLIADTPQLLGKSLQQIKDLTNKGTQRGVYITNYLREESQLEINPELIAGKKDIIEVTGSAEDIKQVEKNIGQRFETTNTTEFVTFGLGMVLGLLIGLISFHIASIPVSIGSGAGCLISGLFVGWLRNRYSHLPSLPISTSNVVRNLALAVFIALVGLEAGPEAIDVIQDHGLTLLFLGAGVTIIPQIISFLFSYYVLKIKNPIEALGCIAGGRNAPSAFAALMEKTGNTTPMFSFTVTYAVANILLTLLGPIIIAIISVSAGM